MRFKAYFLVKEVLESLGISNEQDAPSTFIIKLPRATGSDRLMLDKTDVHNVGTPVRMAT